MFPADHERRAWSILLETREKLGTPTAPPVPIHRIAQDLFHLGVEPKLRERGVTGKLVIPGRRILVRRSRLDTSSRESFTPRQRFTIAHELGHWVLHVKSSGAQFEVCRGKEATRVEQEANSFAACLLMPRRWVYQQLVIETGRLYPTVDLGWLEVSVRNVADTDLKILNSLFFTHSNQGSFSRQGRAQLMANLVPRLATTFAVSKEAMTIRLMEMGLLEGVLT